MREDEGRSIPDGELEIVQLYDNSDLAQVKIMLIKYPQVNTYLFVISPMKCSTLTPL